MKKTIMLFVAVMLSVGFRALFSCDITMETGQVASRKDKINVKLTVECIHKRCTVNIEKTKLTTDNLTIEKQGKWKKTGNGIYQIDLIVSLTGKGKGEIRVRRECPKTGHQEEILQVGQSYVSGPKLARLGK